MSELDYIEDIEKLQHIIETLQQENEKLNGVIQTYDILLKSNVEENQQVEDQIKNYIEEIQTLKIQISAREEEYKKLEDNWNKLKEFLETNWKETQDIWFVKIINKMQKLERSDSK